MTPPRSACGASPPWGAPPVDRQSRLHGDRWGAWWCSSTLVRRFGFWCMTLFMPMAVVAAPLRHEVLDEFRNPGAWKASASDQVKAGLRSDRDGSLCLLVAFGSGFVWGSVLLRM